jgi:hypothetical protein
MRRASVDLPAPLGPRMTMRLATGISYVHRRSGTLLYKCIDRQTEFVSSEPEESTWYGNLHSF